MITIKYKYNGYHFNTTSYGCLVWQIRIMYQELEYFWAQNQQ